MRVLDFKSQYRPGETPYDIFKDRMAAIGSIVSGIKGMIENKYNKGLIDTTIGQLNKSLSKQQQTDMIDLLNAEPTDIYPDEEKLNTMAGQFVDYANVMGNIGREGMASPGMPTGMPTGMPSPGGMPPTSEVMLPKGDKAQLLNAIMSMPEGQMDFAPILKYMEEHRPKMMGSFSPMEEWVMNQAMGQVSDPQEELDKGLSLAKKYSEFFEEPTEERAGKYPYDEKEVKEFEKWKASRKPDISKLIGDISQDPNIELTNFNVSSTGTYSYSFKPKDTTTSWEFNTYEEADAFAKAHPQEGFIPKIETNKQGFDVNWYQKGTGTDLKTPTFYVAGEIEKGFMEKVETVQDFGNELKRLQGLGIDTKTFETTEYFAGLMEKKYEEALSVIKYCTQGIQSGEEADKDGLNYRDTYKEWWEKANNYDQEYFNVTGQHLLEEDSEITKTAIADKTLELAKEMITEKKSLEDLDLDKVKAMGIDIEELKKAYMKLYLTNR